MSTKYKKLILLLFVFIIIISLSACSNRLEKSLKTNFYQITGKVIDNDGNPVGNVKIKSDGGNEVVKSNSDGSYQISVPKDGVKIELVKNGYNFFNNNFNQEYSYLSRFYVKKFINLKDYLKKHLRH